MVASQRLLPWPPEHLIAWRGFAHWLSFEAGGIETIEQDRIEAFRSSYESLKTDWQKFSENARQEQKSVYNESAQLSAQIRKMLDDQKHAHDQLIQDYGKKHLEAMSDHRQLVTDEVKKTEETLENVKRAYEEHMQLKSAVSYWREQERTHNRRAIGFGIFAAAWAVISVAILFFGGVYLFPVASPSETAPTLLQQPPWKLVVVAVTLTLIIWMQRILVRITLSHVHLGTDSGERVTFAKGYMALVKEGAAPTDERRQVVFASLFRPSSTGIVRDDAAPASVAEVWSRIFSGRS